MNDLSFGEQIRKAIVESAFQAAAVCEAAALLTSMDTRESHFIIFPFLSLSGALSGVRPQKLPPTLKPPVISELSNRG